MSKRRAFALLVLIALLLYLLSYIPVQVYSLSKVFSIKYSRFYSRTGGDVYPGSEDAELVIGVQNNATYAVENVYGCIELPQGFTTLNPCSQARYLNGTIANSVEPGEIVELRYSIDVSRDVMPGTYSVEVELSFWNPLSANISSQVITVEIRVESYPPLSLRIVTNYWSPAGYPGSVNVDLVVELENTGESTVARADLYISLPDVFSLDSNHTAITGLSPQGRETAVFTGVDIAHDAAPGSYPAELFIDAVMTTDDGVSYNATTTISFEVSVDKPPSVDVEVLDYGLTADYPHEGLRYTRSYTVLVNYDSATIMQAIARIELINAFFENKSTRAVVTISGPIGYGDAFTVTTPKIVLHSGINYLSYKLVLYMLCSRDGTEYWAEASYTLTVWLEKPKYEVYLVASYWAGSRAYPGSADETLYVELYNAMSIPLTSVYAELELPSGFGPRTLHSGPYSIQAGSISRIAFTGIDVENSTKPGSYIATMAIHGVARQSDGSFAKITLTYSIEIKVYSLTAEILELVDAAWTTKSAYVGMKGTGVSVLARVSVDAEILSGYASLVLPPGVSTSSGRKTAVSEIRPSGYGDLVEISFQDLEVSSEAIGYQPFALNISLLVSLDGVEAWVNETHIFTLYVGEPVLNVSMLEAMWTTRFVSQKMDNAGIAVILQSLSRDSIAEVHAELHLPSEVKASNGLSYIVWHSGNPLTYGEIFTATFGGLVVNTTREELNYTLIVEAVLNCNGGLYRAEQVIEFTLRIPSPEKPVYPVAVQTLYNGVPVRLLPNSHGVVLRVTVANAIGESISTLIGRLEAPEGFVLRNSESYCSNLLPGSTCTLEYVVDAEHVEPGSYEASLDIEYYLVSSGSVAVYRESYSIPLVVDSPEAYDARVELVDYYWGSGAPTEVYPGAFRAALSLVFRNTGDYPAYNPVVSISSLNKSLITMNNVSSCGSILEPGSMCSATFYLDLRKATPGFYKFRASLSYFTRVYGSNIMRTVNYTLLIPVPSPETLLNGSEIAAVESGWLNNWPVYPGSSSAVYVVTLANLLPYPVSSIHAELVVPEGFTEAYRGSLTDYVEGPIYTLQTLTLEFTLNAVDVEPRSYNALVNLTLYVESGQAGYRRTYLIPVVLSISDPSSIVEIVSYGWLGSQPTLDARGAQYYVLVRNREIPSMSGLLAYLELPSGVLYSDTNESYAVLTPTAVIPAVRIEQPMSEEDIIRQLVAGLQQQAVPSNPVLGKGDLATYTLKLNLELEKPGTYWIHGYLEFIDHWNEYYRVNITVPLVVYAKPPVINVEAPIRLGYVNGSALYRVSIENSYSSPIYNVYAVLAPQTPVLVPVNPVKYIPVVQPNSRAVVEYTLVYNPTSTQQIYGPGPVLYNAVFMLTIVYRDVSGAVNWYNTTLPVIVEPHIQIVLSSDTTAVYSGGVVKVSGVVINSGTSYARSVWIGAVYGNSSAYTFLGDLDPASQTAFRLELKVGVLRDRSVKLFVTYLDDYNTTYTRVYQVQLREEAKTETTEQQGGGEEEYSWYFIGTIIGTALFLGLALYIIYRLAKAHTKKLGT